MSTKAGFAPRFNMSAYHPSQRHIISRLALHFYITAEVDPIIRGNSTYNAFLMRPSSALSVVLNVDREIMVLFSPYETFEARSLLAYEHILESFPDTRIDKSLRFFISKDNNVEAAVRSFLTENFEYPIIVPFSYSDFQSPTDAFIYARIRSNHLIRDLFGHQNPLRKEYFFFGRDSIVANTIDQHLTGENSSIFGLRKSGKTSTIYAIERKARSSGTRTVVVDCQDPAVHARRYNGLLAYLVDRVREECNLKRQHTDIPDDPAAASDLFRQCMSQALAELRSNVLLIFDEIENISPDTAASDHWRHGRDALLLWQTLRAFFQRPPKYKLTFCFVGTNPHLLELAKINGIDNPVYLFAKPTFMPNLTFDDARKMMSRLGFYMGLDIPDAVAARIHKFFGGHPFFIRQLCSRIHRIVGSARPVDVSLHVCKQAEAESTGMNSQYIHEILAHLKSTYPEEYEMLEMLGSGNTVNFHELAESYPGLTEHLVGYGLITRRGSDYDFVFDMVHQVIKANQFESHRPTSEDMRRAISDSRNALEEQIRVVLYYWSCRLTDDEWENAYSECAPRLAKLNAHLSRREIFSRNASPLYFLELMKFAKYGNVTGRAEQEQSRLWEAFDIVNKLRVDAHAKRVTEHEYTEWKAAMNLLEDAFLPPG